MKAKLFICALVAGTAFWALADDPVLMTINGKDVHLSEFEYLYQKNSQQQLEKESLDQYVERYVTFKQKVAAAEAEGIDKRPDIIKDIEGRKEEILEPFLVDESVNERLLTEAYDRVTKDVEFDILWLPRGETPSRNKRQVEIADSLRTELINGADFEAIVEQFSIDRTKQFNKGHYGFKGSGFLPYSLEYAAYNTPIGEWTQPITTEYGVHLLRTTAMRKDPGTVHAAHILILAREEDSDSVKIAAKNRIDSIYVELKNGADFAQLAKQFSDDKGSGAKGGDLAWFGTGRMIKEFEDVAFGLNDGEISEPFTTFYGYHIIKRFGHRDTPSFDDLKDKLKESFFNDERASMAADAKKEQIKKEYHFKVNKDFNDYVRSMVEKHGGYDSLLVVDVLGKSDFTIATFDKGQKVPASMIVKQLNTKSKYNTESAIAVISSLAEPVGEKALMEYYKDHLLENNADFRNQMNEYRDGTLMFEVSNEHVWSVADKDPEALEAYFNNHRSAYSWTEPRFKGIILSAQNDSVADAVRAMIPTLGTDTLTMTLHRQFGQQIRMQRMLMKKGQNAMVDYLVFNGPKVPSDSERYPVYFVLEPESKVINQPEEAADVRGQVSTDFTNELEEKWLKDIKQRFPAKINKKALKKIKEL